MKASTSTKPAAKPAAKPAPANAMQKMAEQAVAPVAVHTPLPQAAPDSLVTALANQQLEPLLGCNNMGSFWKTHARQVGKPLPEEWAAGFTLGTLSKGPCGVVRKADRELSTLAIAASVNGTLSSQAAREIGLAPHNIRAWLKRGWINKA